MILAGGAGLRPAPPSENLFEETAMPAKLDISKSYPTFPVLYDVEHSVGYNATNHHDDVLLLQFRLKGDFERTGRRPLGHLPLDGIFGPVTHYWLLFFQLKIQGLYAKQQKSLDMPEQGNVVSLRHPVLAGIPPERTMIGQLNGQFR